MYRVVWRYPCTQQFRRPHKYKYLHTTKMLCIFKQLLQAPGSIVSITYPWFHSSKINMLNAKPFISHHRCSTWKLSPRFKEFYSGFTVVPPCTMECLAMSEISWKSMQSSGWIINCFTKIFPISVHVCRWTLHLDAMMWINRPEKD